MMNNINIIQLNDFREKLISYEHKRDQLKGLNDLTAGLDILSEYLEGIDVAECNVTAKNLLITYRRNSIEWIKRILINCSGDESEILTLIYCKKVIELFENLNEVTGPDKNIHELKLTILKSIIISRVNEGDSIIFNIEKNMPMEEREPAILLLSKILARC